MATKQPAYEYHPLSKKFPRMAPDVFKAFCADIADRGLDKPIELLDGMIFDGRHRYEACLQCDVEPRFVELSEATDGEMYVRAANALRRHLSQEDIAAWLVERRNGQPGGSSPTPPSNRELAKKAGIDRKAVDRADAIDKKAAPELKAAVEQKIVAPTDAAKILDKSPAVQAKAVERVKKGEAKTVKAAVKGKRGNERQGRIDQFKPLTEILSRMTKAIDKLNESLPGGKFYKQTEAGLEAAARALRDWKVAVK